jgi:uncharacterized coiled-coil DUF342 family protein
LHDVLRSFSIPAEFAGQINARAEIIPERIDPIFQDQEEQPGNASLSERIRQALEQSKCLIVICSPRSAKSLQVNEVVRYFQQLGRGNRILPIVIAGEPNASDGKKPGASPDDECFVPALRHPVKPDGMLDTSRRDRGYIFADARHGDAKREILAEEYQNGETELETAKIQLIAGLIGVGFNGLWGREQKRRFAEAQIQVRKARQQVQDLRNQAREALGGVEEARNQAQAAESKVLDAQHLVRETQNQLEDARNQVREAQNKFLEIQNLPQDVKGQIQQAQDKAREAQSQLEDARNQARAAESKVLEAQNQAREAQNQVEEARSQCREEQNRIREIQNQTRDAQSQIQEAQNKAREAQSQLEDARNQARAAESKVLEAQDQAREAQNQVEEARSQCREEQNKIQELQNQTRDAQNQIQDAQNKAHAAQNTAEKPGRATSHQGLCAHGGARSNGGQHCYVAAQDCHPSSGQGSFCGGP